MMVNKAMKNNLFLISKNGVPYIGYSFLAFFIFSFLDLELLATLSFFVIIFFIFVFRNPERAILFYQKNSFRAPCDGVVTTIEQLENSEYAYKIDIESNYLNVGILRVPMNGKVESIELKRGTRTSKKSKLFNDLNEQITLMLVDEANNGVKVIHKLKQSFAPMDVNLTAGKKIVQTARYGHMVNGVTSIYFKQNFRINLNIGQEIKASETLIGFFS